MELANALYKMDMLIDDQGRSAEKEAWNFIRAYIAEVQKPAANSQSTPCFHPSHHSTSAVISYCPKCGEVIG